MNLSKPLLLLLSKFLYPQRSDTLGTDTRWAEVLGARPDDVLHQLTEEGLLGPADPALVLESRFNTRQLHALLKERSLPLSGQKELLVRRLVEADPDGVVTVVQGYNLYACTAAGRALVEQFLATEAGTRRAVQAEVLKHLRAQCFREAVQIVSEFEASQVLPRGLGMDWANHDPSEDIHLLETIFRGHPRILSKIQGDVLESLRLSAALMHLWGLSRTPDWGPGRLDLDLHFDFDTAARMFMFYANHQRRLVHFRDAGIAQLELLGAGADSCQRCVKLRRHWRTAEAIELPYEECVSALGCRCLMIASP